MRKHLTELSVRALKPTAGKQVKVWDTTTRGFGIRINGSSKSWIVMHGKGRNLKVLGRYPDMNLADARLAAKKVLIAPAAPRASLRFDEVLSRFLDENYVGKAERTKSEAKRLLDKYFLPTLARKKMSDITDVYIGNCLDAISAPSERLHTYRVARTLFRWATRAPHRFIQHSPLEGFRPPHKDGSRERVLSDSELVAVWQACEGQFGVMIKLLVLLGLRRGEVAKLRWQWIEGSILTIPSDETKNRRALSLTLPSHAAGLIAGIPRNGDYLFPGRWDNETYFNDGSWGKLKRQLDSRMDICPAGTAGQAMGTFQSWTIHDLRRTFSTNLVDGI